MQLASCVLYAPFHFSPSFYPIIFTHNLICSPLWTCKCLSLSLFFHLAKNVIFHGGNNCNVSCYREMFLQETNYCNRIMTSFLLISFSLSISHFVTFFSFTFLLSYELGKCKWNKRTQHTSKFITSVKVFFFSLSLYMCVFVFVFSCM